MKIKWKSLANFEDILYEYHKGIAKITINRPEVRNAFRPKTIAELQKAKNAIPGKMTSAL